MKDFLRKQRNAPWLFAALLAAPAIAVHVWLVCLFPSYLGARFAGDVIFALVWCGLMVSLSRWRLFGPASWPVATLLYFVWLLLVFSEAVSYYLQADTFNNRFFAHLDPENLDTGLHAFPLLIGGGLLLLSVLLVLTGWLLRRVALGARTHTGLWSPGKRAAALITLLLVALAVDSTPRRLVHYFAQYQRSFAYADTAAGRKVLRLIDPDPVTRPELMAAPGRNVVILYMESLERMYADPKVFPGLTPNLDRLRKQGLDFSGFETFSDATYTIAGMFASQCGVPLYTSPFSAFDYAAGNNNDETTFQRKLVCLGDVLHAAGYRQVYMGGAPIAFSRKGLFYRLHGYDQALGLDQLEAQAGGNLPQSGWDLYDSDLFRLAMDRYRELERSGKPFNLSMITLDTHPPDGRPSPGCPAYTRLANSMLQAVHCTDFLIGKFIDALAREPAWKNTVVLVMSDHLALRNDSEPLYPPNYHRQPLMFVLNAGRGERAMRFYHMDVAPTLLHLMGVRTNATFIAGADRSAANAPGSRLADDDVTDAVLRGVLWSRASEFRLCKKNVLLQWISPGHFDIGGRELAMADQGEAEIAPDEDELLTFFIDKSNASLLLTHRSDLDDVLKDRGKADVLLIDPHPAHGGIPTTFSIDWMNAHGARTHLGDVPYLRGLRIEAHDCAQALAALDDSPTGRQDDHGKFKITVAPVAQLPANRQIEFGRADSSQQAANASDYKVELGWIDAPTSSWTQDDYNSLLFQLPSSNGRCEGTLDFLVDPYLPRSRPALDVQVLVNGREATRWHFSGAADGQQRVSAPLALTANDACVANVGFRFSRPGPKPVQYPADEDPRDLQLGFIEMQFAPKNSSG